MDKKLNLIKVVKIAFGSCIAVLAAMSLHLSYSTSAGIITILSIQNTRKETLFMVIRRVAAFLIALFLAYVCFSLLGYRLRALGIFLLLFASICHMLSFHDAIAMDTVLITHFFAEQSMSAYWIRNECLLLLIGVGIGILMNLYIPDKVKEIKRDQEQIEEKMRMALGQISILVMSCGSKETVLPDFDILEEKLREALKKAVENRDNILFTDTSYYLQYMHMRKEQTAILKRVAQDTRLLTDLPSQAYAVRELIEQIQKGFHEYNNAEGLLKELEEVRIAMKKEPLPKSREEFENRAVLFRILYEIESFLWLKKQFVDQLSKKQISRYWDMEGQKKTS